MVITRLSSWYETHEYRISSIALFGGFVFDILTLQRADSFFENLIVMLHLTIVAVSILILNRPGDIQISVSTRLHFWLTNLIQFSFGGLLSAFLILYFRSATLSASWPFLLILAFVFLANERLRKHYSMLIFQVSFFFLALMLFFIFFVPVVVGNIGPFIFVFSGLLSLLVLWVFLLMLRRINNEGYLVSFKAIRISVLGIFATMNILYFANIIPPIPLSLQDGGIYHFVSRNSSGDYVVEGEEKNWVDYLRLRQKVAALPGQPLFVYTSIFSPARFNTKIVHEWQYFDEEINDWSSISRIPLTISGGREQGFRTYSSASVLPGRWRVLVLTEQGLVLGSIGFDVVSDGYPPSLIRETH
ncbi:MAG: DUF2914 domain-containing protein [Minisyncoccota bacterium]